MDPIERKLAEMRERMRKEVGEAIVEIGDVISEVRRDYIELGACAAADPEAVDRMLIDVLRVEGRVPRIIPDFAIRWVIRRYLLKR
jgi:hypothetical protein